jgi:hypothetical protein
MAGGRCIKHGGKTGPTGIAHPSFKHGRYVKSLPSRLAAQFEESESDPELMSLKAEVALIDARVADLLLNAHEGGAHSVFADISKAWKQLQYANKDKDKQKINDAIRAMNEAINAGRSEALVWEQINKLIETRRKMVLAEGKRLQMLDQFITVQEANVFMATMVAIVVREVSDRSQVASILGEFQKLVGERGRAAMPQGPVVARLTDGEIEYE